MQAAVRIGELARRTGVSPELLRAWEQRYGLLRPERSAGGFRLYSADDEARVRRMTALLAEGVSAAEAARQSAAVEAVAVPLATPSLVDDLRGQLRAALDRFDTEAAHAALDRVFATVSVEAAIDGVVIPYLRDLGERWATGRASVAQEHFSSNLLRGRLLGLGRDWGAGDGPAVVLASLPREMHDLGLVMFGVLVARRGWSVTFLGGDTPWDTLDETVRALQPAAVVLSTVSADLFREHTDAIAAVAWCTRLAVAAPVDEMAAAACGARVLTSGIVDAARSFTV